MPFERELLLNIFAATLVFQSHARKEYGVSAQEQSVIYHLHAFWCLAPSERKFDLFPIVEKWTKIKFLPFHMLLTPTQFAYN